MTAAQDEEVLGEAKNVSEFQAEPVVGYRCVAADLPTFFRSSCCRDASSQPLRPSGAVSSPPYALTRVHVVEERRNPTGIETGETVRGPATGMQQLLALLLLLRRHREERVERTTGLGRVRGSATASQQLLALLLLLRKCARKHKEEARVCDRVFGR